MKEMPSAKYKSLSYSGAYCLVQDKRGHDAVWSNSEEKREIDETALSYYGVCDEIFAANDIMMFG